MLPAGCGFFEKSTFQKLDVLEISGRYLGQSDHAIAACDGRGDLQAGTSSVHICKLRLQSGVIPNALFTFPGSVLLEGNQ